jgi:NAD(P)-dependent dehydrogenase (short-subunit alcohol dehydrogenase family)
VFRCVAGYLPRPPTHAFRYDRVLVQEADCKAMVDLAVSKYGGLHIMFNNAGIMHSNVCATLITCV